MEHSDLIMSIVFDNSTNAFSSPKEIPKNACKLLMMTFPHLCKTNANIMKACNNYTAQYFYEKIHDNLVSIAIEKLNNKSAALFQDKEQEILLSIWSSHKDIQNSFRDLMLAEYKEYTYLSIFHKLHEVETGILMEYERFIQEWYTADDIEVHFVDKSNVLYVGNMYYHTLYL